MSEYNRTNQTMQRKAESRASSAQASYRRPEASRIYGSAASGTRSYAGGSSTGRTYTTGSSSSRTYTSASSNPRMNASGSSASQVRSSGSQAARIQGTGALSKSSGTHTLKSHDYRTSADFQSYENEHRTSREHSSRYASLQEDRSNASSSVRRISADSDAPARRSASDSNVPARRSTAVRTNGSGSGNGGNRGGSGRISDNGGSKKKKPKKKLPTPLIVTLSIIVAVIIAVVVISLTQIGSLKKHAYAMKDNLSAAVDSLKELNVEEIEAHINAATEEEAVVRSMLANPFWQLAAKMPIASNDISNVNKLLDIYDDANTNMVQPLLQAMKVYPPSELKVDGGYNVTMINQYLDLMDQMIPDIQRIAPELESIHFDHLSLNLNKYIDKLNEAFDLLDDIQYYEPLLRTVLGHGEDKLYLVMAQNSAEMRASGGFPGSMCTISVTNGVLKIGDFGSVYNVLKSHINNIYADIDYNESNLFGEMYVLYAHDACYNPDFSRVAWISKVAYDEENGASLDGVISLTPVIIQRILAVTGKTVTLSDGTEVNGSNATLVIQRDLYFKYQGTNETADSGNAMIDTLFAEIAKTTMSALTDDLSVSMLPEVLQLFKDGAADRTIMLWMNDDDEEALMESYGCSGKLNSDENNPVAGVYFSNTTSSKLGIFIDIYTTVSEGRINKDGEYEYDVTVEFRNNINEDNSVSGWYVTGGAGGYISGNIYFFAPAGGTITNFDASDGSGISRGEYKDLDLLYSTCACFAPGETVTYTYTITTKKGVTTPLKVETTPTLNFGDLEASAYATGGYSWAFETETTTTTEETTTTKETTTEEETTTTEEATTTEETTEATTEETDTQPEPETP